MRTELEILRELQVAQAKVIEALTKEIELLKTKIKLLEEFIDNG